MIKTPETICVWLDISVAAEEQGVIEGEWDNSKPNDDDEVSYTRTDLIPQWQPIKTAPKDGKPFIMGWPDYVPEMAMWDVGTKQFVRSVWQRGPREFDENIPDPLQITFAEWIPIPLQLPYGN